MRRGECVDVNKLRSDDQEPYPKSEAQWAFGNPAGSNGAEDYTAETAEDQVLEQTGTGAAEEAMGSATDEREEKAEKDVGADDLSGGKGGKAQEGGGA